LAFFFIYDEASPLVAILFEFYLHFVYTFA